MIGKSLGTVTDIFVFVVLESDSFFARHQIPRTDPDRPRAFYDLTKDAEKLLRGIDVQTRTGFSVIKHWKPSKYSISSHEN